MEKIPIKLDRVHYSLAAILGRVYIKKNPYISATNCPQAIPDRKKLKKYRKRKEI